MEAKPVHIRGPAVAYAIVGLAALGLILGGAGDTSDAGSGVGMIVFGALFLSAAVSGLLGVLAGSRAHAGWAAVGFIVPGYSLPFLVYYGLRGRAERERLEAARAAPPRRGASGRARRVSG